ncbi:hypothetical protein BJ944DRAFT_261110 [Cunninghamella echinulata]|nr:hypothetical protein BJ944DRAFT_261110 [Cunninghamella echinulata]
MTYSIYISGATGYIGGAVVGKLLKDKQFTITALVRSEEKAIPLRKQGINAVIGSLQDSQIIEEQVFKHDITITSANCDSLDEAQAVVKGLERKYNETGKRGILIQTSGSGFVLNLSKPFGNDANETVYSDLDNDALNSIPVTNPHRHVDDYLINHSAHFDLVLIAPTTIFGEPTVTTSTNIHSQQIPYCISVAIENKASVQIGDALNTWSFVHIDELADLYLLILDKLIKHELSEKDLLGKNGYFFAESGSYLWRDAFEAIGKNLHQLGVIPSPTPKIITTNDEFAAAYKVLAYLPVIGGSSHVKADKGKQLGWHPKKNADDFFRDIERETKVFAKKRGFIQ